MVYLFFLLQDIKSYCLDIRGDFLYPIIADETHELAVQLDMIDEDNMNNEAEAMTVRALYIIGPDHKLRLSMLYPASTGRNVEWVDDAFFLHAVRKCLHTLQTSVFVSAFQILSLFMRA